MSHRTAAWLAWSLCAVRVAFTGLALAAPRPTTERKRNTRVGGPTPRRAGCHGVIVAADNSRLGPWEINPPPTSLIP